MIVKLNLKSMKEESGKRSAFDETEQWGHVKHKGRSLPLARDVRLRGEAAYKSASVHVDVRLTTEIELECSRCLKPLPVPVNLDDSIDLYEEPEGGFNGAPIEGFAYEHGTEMLDLTPYFARLVDSSLETKPLCRPDCKGLCPECGTDLNFSDCGCSEKRSVDPRLEKLKELLT